jgi:Peptidase propeptide and YPEB domain
MTIFIQFLPSPCWLHPRPNATVVGAPRVPPRLSVLAGHPDLFDSAEGKRYIALRDACPFYPGPAFRPLPMNENEIRSDGIRCCWDYQWSTLALAETPVAPAEEEKIKATIEGFGCTGGKIEKADYGYDVDDVKCKDGQEYEIKLDPNFKLIVMTRD